MEEMHEYKIIGKKFDLINIGIWFFSLILAYIIHVIVTFFEGKFGISLWLFEIPSVIGVYEKSNKLINKSIWSKLYKINDLSGIWEGNLQTSFDNYGSSILATCKIIQEFDKILIVLETEKSISYSIKAVLQINSLNEMILDYDYINIPKIRNSKDLNIHFGHNTFRLNNNKELCGEYYNKQRNTRGEILLRKREEKK